MVSSANAGTATAVRSNARIRFIGIASCEGTRVQPDVYLIEGLTPPPHPRSRDRRAPCWGGTIGPSVTTYAAAAAPSWSGVAAGGRSVDLRHVGARVVRPQDLAVVLPRLGASHGAPLAHACPVPPAAAVRDPVVALAIEDEHRRGQVPQEAPDLELAGDLGGPVAPRDAQVACPTRDAARADLERPHDADAEGVPDVLQVGGGQPPLPAPAVAARRGRAPAPRVDVGREQPAQPRLVGEPTRPLR